MNALQPRATAPQAEPPFVLRRPAVPTPLVFASPHSGRRYPDDLLQASALDDRAIRKSEDAFVDELIDGAVEHGAAVIACSVARAYVDVNREPWELDPAMFEDDLPPFARAQTARVQAGLGSIAKVVAEGQEIYARKLTFAEAEARIGAVHAPYHKALAALVAEAKARFGLAVLIDWHSMPSAAGRAESRRGRIKPDVVLGDRHGEACGRPLSDLVRRELEAAGYAVAMNSPYAGGWTTQTYGRPKDGVHALQIELDRGLYLDERRVEPGAGFAGLKADLERLFARLAAADWAALHRT
ncbi:MAG TPA: N-formylglutamate amidohydrolase [Caulobacteraceae bacterium]|nr:N-formylglutamate amidohydrolase [Caulobacteraceae bacterium]